MIQKTKKPKRLKSVRLKVTAEEKSEYEQAAADLDTSMSDWIRKTLRAELTRIHTKVDE